MKIRNCIVLGSGRSGTSMAAGVLSKSGYFMGENLYPGDEANPKGYFEDIEINNINEELLAQVVPKRPQGILGDLFFPSRLSQDQRWFARIAVGTSIPCPSQLAERIRIVTAQEPFCFKDPRFCYTLPAWRPCLRSNVVFLCVFRQPGTTANSIVKEARRSADNGKMNLYFDFAQALKVWELMYTHILETHYPQGGEWLFLHYQQFLDGSGFKKIEEKLGITVDRSFVDSKLNRSEITKIIPNHILSIYSHLCNLSGYVCEDYK